MSLAKWSQTVSITEAWSPEEVIEQKINAIPPEIIEAVNELLAKHWSGYSANIKLDTIRKLAKAKMNANGSSNAGKDFSSEGWLDFEPIFEKKGWKVVYDQPGYCESYDANFTFTRAKQ